MELPEKIQIIPRTKKKKNIYSKKFFDMPWIRSKDFYSLHGILENSFNR